VVEVHVRLQDRHVIVFVALVIVLTIVLLFFGRPGITGAIVIPPSGNLSCSMVVSASCPGGLTKVLGVSNVSNAHAEIPGLANYTTSVCCNDSSGANTIGNSGGTVFAHLSNFSNAHMEIATQSSYGFNVSLNASNATVSCAVNETGAGSCAPGYGCVVTLSSDSNAHVSNCTGSAYNVTVCCVIGGLTTVYFQPDSGFANLLVANGSINGTLVNASETGYFTQEITFINGTSAKRFVRFTGLFNQSDVDMRALTLDTNESAIASNASGVSGTFGNHSAFLDRTINNLGVRVCPSATTVLDLNDSCPGGIDFTGSPPQTISGITLNIDGNDFRIDNLTNTGVFLITVLNSTVNGSNILNSTIANSTVINSNISNSTIAGSTVINSTINDSTKIDSTIIDSIVLGSTNMNCTVINSMEVSSTCNNSSIVDSTVINSTLNDLNVTNSTITNNVCTSGSLVFKGFTYVCPISLSQVYAQCGDVSHTCKGGNTCSTCPADCGGCSGGGGNAGTGSGAGAAAGSAAGAAASSGAAGAAGVSSVSVQAAALTSLSGCKTAILRKTNVIPPIPQGFALVGQPSFTCYGSVADFTLNIQEQFAELAALRCRRGQCVQVKTAEEVRDQLPCGNATVKELRQRELAQIRAAVNSSAIPVVAAEDRFVSAQNPQVSADTFAIEFVGQIPKDTLVRAGSSPVGAPLPPSPSVVLIMPPVNLSFAKAPTFGARINLSYPEQLKGVTQSTLSIAAFKNGQWTIIGGTVDIYNRVVGVKIDDLSAFVENDRAVFGLLGVVCDACTRAKLTQQYTDGVSRRAFVLVPGLTSHALKFGTLIDDFRLNEQPWQVYTFDYPVDAEVDANAQEMIDLFDLHAAEFDEIYVLGHSLGGLITQTALRTAYDQNKLHPGDHPWLRKVRKVIVVGTPNEGSPTADVYRYVLAKLYNLSFERDSNFNLSVIHDLAEGKSVEPVPGVDYQIIVGTKSIPFTQNLFGAKTNDGVLTTTSGSTLGGVAFTDRCKDYYEINITHIDLDDNPTAIRVVERILNKELAKEQPQIPLVGYNQYLRVAVGDCDPGDDYFIIGKPLPQAATFDPLLCACGNGYCNIGETQENCPQDCARISWTIDACITLYVLNYPLLILLALGVFVFVLRKYVLKRLVSKRSLVIALGVMFVLLIFQSIVCSHDTFLAYLGWFVIGAVLLIDSVASRRSVPATVLPSVPVMVPLKKQRLQVKQVQPPVPVEMHDESKVLMAEARRILQEAQGPKQKSRSKAKKRE